ncbi:MAG TPA: cyclase family protein [Acidimicrobiales bacterium]|nr:cyclase family protein [Acidimicrobiales bacterium]
MGLPEAFAAIAARVNNWGRWGPDDQVGTVNLITDDVRRKAAACVRTGKVFPLGLALSEAEGIQKGVIPGRFNPVRTMSYVDVPLADDPEWICANEDIVTMPLQCATHWDALAHVSHSRKIYNGFPQASVTSAGASKCGIHLVESLVSRGVLLDVARARGVDVLDGGYPISPDDLDVAMALGGTDVESGDIVLVRTGQMAHLRLRGRFPSGGATIPTPNVLGFGDVMRYIGLAPGLTMATAEWFHARDVAAVATDTLSLEVVPCEDDTAYLPVHLLHLVEMGMTQGQNFVLDALAEDCAADGVYCFLLDATPLPFTNGLGSPVNPIAVK